MTKATLYHDGLVKWEPPAIFKSSCDIDVSSSLFSLFPLLVVFFCIFVILFLKMFASQAQLELSCDISFLNYYSETLLLRLWLAFISNEIAETVLNSIVMPFLWYNAHNFFFKSEIKQFVCLLNLSPSCNVTEDIISYQHCERQICSRFIKATLSWLSEVSIH